MQQIGYFPNLSHNEEDRSNVAGLGITSHQRVTHFRFSFSPRCRIRNELLGGAWCPSGPIDEKSYEFLQISFPRLRVVTLVETQGRFGNGQVGG